MGKLVKSMGAYERPPYPHFGSPTSQGNGAESKKAIQIV